MKRALYWIARYIGRCRLCINVGYRVGIGAASEDYYKEPWKQR